jgi:hypothetical protein
VETPWEDKGKMNFDMSQRVTREGLRNFAEELQELSGKIGFKVSARGWCYQMETEGLITKAEFDRVEGLINKCREEGILPIDFTAEEEGRQFSGVEKPNTNTPIEDMRSWIEAAMKCEEYYTPNWWEGEEYYIQMVVEKIDLKTLFEPVCKKYHIPIATSKGWSSMLQRATYARRFKEAEARGINCVLLYCGDFDPDGLRISDFLKKNIGDLREIVWEDGKEGYDPQELEIIRFGLDYDFIVEHKLTWIPNLITGSKKNLADPNHKNHHMSYVQEYIHKYGVRKCEANAIVPMPTEARRLVTNAITSYLGKGAVKRFEEKRQAVRDIVNEFRDRTGLNESMERALEIIDEEET